METNHLFAELGLTPGPGGIHPGVFDGTWTGGGASLASLNPATGEIIATASTATAADYERVVAAASQAFAYWRTVPAPARGELVRRIGQSFRTRKAALGTLVSMEVGKILQEGLGEVQEVIDIADFAVGQSRMLYGKSMHSERPQHRMSEQWHPLGVVGVISAFNFPVAVWAWNAMIAAVCGNVVVWKPSPKAPLTAIAAQRLANAVCEELGHPPLFFLVTPDGTGLTLEMAHDRRLPLLSFTGSTEVGRLVAREVAGRLGRSLLECAGNNAVIVDETANLDLVVPAVLFGAIGTAGQRCTTTRRLIIHASVYDAVVQRLRATYAQVRIGNPLEEGVLVGPLIDEHAVRRYLDTIDAAQAAGGRVLCGGRRLDGVGHFVAPTLIEAENHWEVVQQETFAPILYLMRYHTLEQAIELQNSVPQGLSSALFTDRLQHAEQFLSATGSDCGIANINIGTSGAEVGGAFGGEKDTGGGREAGSDAWQTYMRRQTNTVNWGRNLPLAQGIRFDPGDHA